MARSQRRRATSALRQGLVMYLERMQERFPFMDKRESIAHVRSGGAIELDTGTVFSALHEVNPLTARPFNHRADVTQSRRWLLTADDDLLELPPDAPTTNELRRLPDAGGTETA